MFELALETVRDHRMLVARFARAQRFLSWAIVGGGATRGHEVAWCQVKDRELTLEVDPAALLSERLSSVGIPQAVGLMTSSDVGLYVQQSASAPGIEARCVVTVGLGNRLRIGDSPGAPRPVGTINLVCAISRPLNDRAMVEAAALCAEARTVAILESGALSLRSGLAASGTGTDCHVVASPEEGEPLAFAGKHTEAGHLIGQAVLSAVTLGARAWLAEHARD
jgi:adenosylcobinamide amidohydrolase